MPKAWFVTGATQLGQFQGLLRRFHGLGEPSCLGVGGGQCIERGRVLVAGELHCLPGQFDRLGAVADRCIRIGGQQPSQIISSGHISSVGVHGLLVVLKGLPHAALDEPTG